MEHVTRAQLVARGATDRQIRSALDRGELIRARRGHFCTPDVDVATLQAIRVGGRLTCVSELRRRGIWVLDDGAVHVRVDVHATRLRLDAGVHLHWSRPQDPPADPSRADLIEALVDAARCLDHRGWIASVDSALQLGQLHSWQLPQLRERLSTGRRSWIDLLDRRSESGLESIVRVIAVELGFRVRSQVRIPGIGRVDLVVEDWIVVETDGSAFHDTALSPRDRRRDASLFATGRSVIRPGYSLVVHDQQAVARQLIGAVSAHRRVKNSGALVSRARRRVEKCGFSGVVDSADRLGAAPAGTGRVSGRAARATPPATG